MFHGFITGKRIRDETKPKGTKETRQEAEVAGNKIIEVQSKAVLAADEVRDAIVINSLGPRLLQPSFHY
jgi:hypothetical protein